MVTLTCIFNLPAILSRAYDRWQIGQQFDRRIFVAPQFTLRITAFHERGPGLGAPGGFYRYAVQTASDRRWRTIVMFRLPVPERIPNGHFRSVTDSCAYFSHGHVFGVTTNGGMTWSIRGGDNPPIFDGHNFPYADIETVTIEPDGTGVMGLSDYDPTQMKPLPSHALQTSDFGQTWEEY